jgi:hypothetical protein
VGELFFETGVLADGDVDGTGEVAANAPVTKKARMTPVSLRKRG